jgi:hypothetical protein
MLGHGWVAVHGVQRGSIVGGEFAQCNELADELDGIHQASLSVHRE